jgi:hypothetical protein
MKADLDESRMHGQSFPRASVDGWTPHSEAAQLVDKCFAVGAVVGIVNGVARPKMGK